MPSRLPSEPPQSPAPQPSKRWKLDDEMRGILPDHIEEKIALIGRMEAEHHEAEGASHRIARFITITLGRPLASTITALLIASWILLNLAFGRMGISPLDAPPFQWLELVVSICSLFVIFVVLATQQRDDELAQLHQRLALQLAISAEQKAAKTIQLLEQLRQDHPAIPDRKDDEAVVMSRPTNPEVVLNAIKSEHP
jgi:uncharacterized membrane protein